MAKQVITLTESQLRQMIQETVNEAMMDEGLWGGVQSLGSFAKNKMSQAGEKLSNGVQGLGTRVKQGYEKAKEGVANAYQNTKNAYNAGTINQDAQKAVVKAVAAIENLIQADANITEKGLGRSVIGNKGQRQIVNQCLSALKNIAGRFAARRSAMTK